MSKILVSVNEEKLKQQIKQKIRQEISNRINRWQHTNSSGSQSPAQWWVDKPVYQGAKVRHELQTDINAFMSGDVLNITLIYKVVDISP